MFIRFSNKVLQVLVLMAMFVGIISVSFAQEPEQKFQGFNLQGYEDNGDKAWDVKGDTADIEGSKIKLTNVNANAYGEQKMNVTAETGTIDQASGSMRLEKDVVMTSEQGGQLMTDTLDWKRDQDLVTTKDDVIITDEKMTLTGKGMQASPGLKTATIEEDVRLRVDTQSALPKEQFVTITSDGPMTIDQAKGMAIFEVNVVAKQEGKTLRSDRMEIYFDQGQSSVREMVCLGNVEIIQGENKSYADKVTYTTSDQKLVLSGKPKLIMMTEGDNAITSFGN